jgi:hypothetical protein
MNKSGYGFRKDANDQLEWELNSILSRLLPFFHYSILPILIVRRAMEALREEVVSDEDLAQVEELSKSKGAITSEIKKVIVGQEKAIEEILIALFCRGHCLLVGVPGLAKTLLISTLAGIMELKFNRVQFTSDLMPSDITGTDVLEEDGGKRRSSGLSRVPSCEHPSGR